MGTRSTARSKLNASYFHGSFFVAAVVGGLAQSWLIFGLTLIALLVGNLIAGEIRMGKRWRRDDRINKA